jgi:hypothetical protein
MRSTGVILFPVLLALAAAPATAQFDDINPWEDVQFWNKRDPSLTLSYGTTAMTLPGFVQDLGRTGFMQLVLGATRSEPLLMSSSVFRHRQSGLAVALMSNDIGPAVTPPTLETTSWQFGGSNSRGYGYYLDDEEQSAFLLGNGGGLRWTKLDVKGDILAQPDSDLIGLWDGSFRFGTAMQAGLGVRVAPLLTIHGGFERTLSFRRHLFGKWLGSELIEGVADWALTKFLRRIEKSSPEAVPVVHFVLSNALSYGFSQLRREQMNWPFTSEAPLVYDTFRLGATFVF